MSHHSETRTLLSSGQLVICSPFPSSTVQKKKGPGLQLAAQQLELTELKVLVETYDPGKLPPLEPGDIVFVRGDRYTHPWAKERLTAEGVYGEFILVPVNEILMVSKKPLLSKWSDCCAMAPPQPEPTEGSSGS